MNQYADKITKLGPDDCWPWTGGKTNGYGSIRLPGGAHEYAHRLTYMTYVGPIAPGLVVDHVCHNRDANCPAGNECAHRACQNPAHLELTTIGENRRRAPIAGAAKIHAAKTSCINGHRLTPDNLMNRKDGVRTCKTCAKIRRDAHRAKAR